MARRVRKKKASHHGGHHGGSWKVAYADFVTAMMALFLVLWLVAQGDQKLKASIANYFREPGAFDTAPGNIFKESGEGKQEGDGKPATITRLEDLKALNTTAALLRSKLSQMASRDRIKIDMSEEGLHIQILDKADRASFPSGSAELEQPTREILSEIATTICELPNPIQIGGHTDSYTFPGMAYTNWELSADRANAARRELETDCVKADRIRRIVGYADTKPLILDDPYAPANRRISILLFFQKVPATETTPETDKPEEAAPATGKQAVDKTAVDRPDDKSDNPSEEETPVKEKPQPTAPARAQHSPAREPVAAKPVAAKPVASQTTRPAAPAKAKPVDLRLEERARRVQKDASVKETSP